MKKILLLAGVVLSTVLFQTCREEEPEIKVNTGKVQFAFHASSRDASGGRALQELPDDAILFITLNHSYGPDYPYGIPFNDFPMEVPLLKFGDEFISTPLALPPTDYRVIDFFITNADHEVLFATPRENSPLASMVETPVPNIGFDVVENGIINLSVEVVAVEGHEPEDFGYSVLSVDPDPKPLVFKLSVLAPHQGGVVPTGAQAYIIHDQDTILNKRLKPGNNRMEFDYNLDEYYTLVLIEPSYKKYSRTFLLRDLNDEIGANPLTVELLPAFTFTVGQGGEFSFILGTAPSTTLSIDWGDGTFEDTQGGDLSHRYDAPGYYFVSISGNLEGIERFQLLYAELPEVSLQHLSGLKEFFLAFSKTSPTIDFSHNLNLENLFFAEVTITSLDISHNVKLKNLGVNFIPDFPTSSIDSIIHALLQNVIDQNIHGGDLKIVANWGSENIIGNPSPTALDELHTLQDVYGWAILPEDF